MRNRTGTTEKNRIDNSTKVVSSSIDQPVSAVKSVDKSLIEEILQNMPANSKARRKIIEKYGGY